MAVATRPGREPRTCQTGPVTAPPEPAPDRARLDLTRLHGAMLRLLTFFRPGLLRVRRGAWRTPTGHAWQPAIALEAVLTA